jgi:hypothetical protein
MPKQKSAKRASIEMLKRFQREAERVSEWQKSVMEADFLNPPIGFDDGWGRGLRSAMSVERVIKWLTEEDAQEAIPMPPPRRRRKSAKDAAPE